MTPDMAAYLHARRAKLTAAEKPYAGWKLTDSVCQGASFAEELFGVEGCDGMALQFDDYDERFHAERQADGLVIIARSLDALVGVIAKLKEADDD